MYGLRLFFSRNFSIWLSKYAMCISKYSFDETDRAFKRFRKTVGLYGSDHNSIYKSRKSIKRKIPSTKTETEKRCNVTMDVFRWSKRVDQTNHMQPRSYKHIHAKQEPVELLSELLSEVKCCVAIRSAKNLTSATNFFYANLHSPG